MIVMLRATLCSGNSMTGMGRPKHFQPLPRFFWWGLLAFLVAGAVLADYFGS